MARQFVERDARIEGVVWSRLALNGSGKSRVCRIDNEEGGLAMRINRSATWSGVLCGAFLFVAAAPASATPFGAGLVRDDAASASSILHLAKKYDAPTGKRCIKWNRRWNPSHGFGHRRCIHWK